MRLKDKHEESHPTVPSTNATGNSSQTKPKEAPSSSEGPTVDVHKKLLVIKSHQPIFEQHISHIKNQPKKPVNIPLCEVTLDQDYDENVSATYNLPVGYVKYVKNIGEEVDLTVDYHADVEDEVKSIFISFSGLSPPNIVFFFGFLSFFQF
jgi:hypothetical protein